MFPGLLHWLCGAAAVAVVAVAAAGVSAATLCGCTEMELILALQGEKEGVENKMMSTLSRTITFKYKKVFIFSGQEWFYSIARWPQK